MKEKRIKVGRVQSAIEKPHDLHRQADGSWRAIRKCKKRDLVVVYKLRDRNRVHVVITAFYRKPPRAKAMCPNPGPMGRARDISKG